MEGLLHTDSSAASNDTGLKRAAVHYLVSVIVLAVYGGQVCPYIDGLSIGYWLVVLGVFFGAALLARDYLVVFFLRRTAFDRMPGRQFFLEFAVMVSASVAITVFNMLNHDFPLGSGLKIVVGTMSLAFFASADMALERERIIYGHFAKSGLPMVPKGRYFPVTAKFLVLSSASVIMITAVIFLVISKDLEWLGDLGYSDPAQAQLAVLVELAFIGIIVLAGTINLIHSYSRNLRLYLENENSSLLAVSKGILTRPAVVSTNDEFGVTWSPIDAPMVQFDPIKIAEGKYLADERAIHFGLIPRANRGIFSINELPDLAEKVQVGLFNIMEERDIQIKGFAVMLKLDVLVVASANPEDYTNRGRIITPLKDRYSSQIRTHYPATPEIETKIVERERRRFEDDGHSVSMPDFMQEILTQITFLARANPEVNQHSGVSVRMSISNAECLLSNAEKRAIRLGEEEVAPRISDLASIISLTAGKLEMESFSGDGAEDRLISHLVDEAVKLTFDKHFSADSMADSMAGVVDAFQSGASATVSDSTGSKECRGSLSKITPLAEAVDSMCPGCAPATFASAAEFILEGLYLNGRISKESLPNAARYGE